MRIELLGAGGYHPSERRHTACVFAPGLGLLLDAGTGAFRLLPEVAREGLPGGRLDVVLTHAHLDHVAGLTYLFGLEHEGRPIETVIHAAPRVIAAVEDHLLAPAIFPIRPFARIEPLGASLELPCGACLCTFPLEHPGDSLGIRVEADGRSFAYVTDTRPPTPASIEAFRGVDVLLHEAYFTERRRELAATTGHCTAREAAQSANAAGAGRLVMVHLDPRADEATEAVGLAEARALRPEAEYGTDGMVIEW